MTAIPCKRPKVVVCTGSPVHHRAECHVAGCDWTYGPTAAKSDAQEQARRHRAQHRNAVPALIDTNWSDGRPATACDSESCAWVTPPGFTTRDDRNRLAQAHLVDAHGLVTT